MHRSGTSLAASLLQSAGVDVGSRLMEGNWSNPRGHFEDMDFIEFHRATLVQLGLHQDGWLVSPLPPLPHQVVDRARQLVHEKQRSARPWGWKDPRSVLFLPLWRSLLPGATFAIVYRAPSEVIESLYRRGDPILANDPELAIRSWQSYNHTLLELATTTPDRCVVVNVETITSEPAGWVAAIAERSGLALAPPNTDLYEPTLLHGDEARDRAELVHRYYPEVFDVFSRLEARAYRPSGTLGAPAVPTISADEQRRRVMREWRALSSALAERDRARRELEQVHAAVKSAQDALEVADQSVTKATSRVSGAVGNALWLP